MKKNVQIQALRGLFCLMIVLYHLLFRYNQIYNEVNLLSSNSYNILALIGVSGFFILSGLFNSKPIVGDIKFITKTYMFKFLNIYLVYLISIIIIFPIDLLGFIGEERIPTVVDLVKNIFFIQYFSGKYIDGSHWYIIVLFIYYFFSYVIALIKCKNNKIIYIIYLVLSVLISFFINIYKQDTLYLKILNKIFCFQYFPIILLGIVIYEFSINKNDKKNNVSLIILLLLCYINMVLYNLNYIYILPIITLFIYYCYVKKLYFLEKLKFLILLGNSSFSIYLLHQYIGFTIINVNISKIGFFLAFIISLVSVILIGIIYSRIVEVKIKKLLKNIYNKIGGYSNE